MQKLTLTLNGDIVDSHYSEVILPVLSVDVYWTGTGHETAGIAEAVVLYGLHMTSYRLSGQRVL